MNLLLQITVWVILITIILGILFAIILLVRYSRFQRKEDKRKKKIADQAVELMIKERKKKDKELDEEQKNI